MVVFLKYFWVLMLVYKIFVRLSFDKKTKLKTGRLPGSYLYYVFYVQGRNLLFVHFLKVCELAE